MDFLNDSSFPMAWQYPYFFSSGSLFDNFRSLQAYSGLFSVSRGGVTAFKPGALRSLRFMDLLSNSSLLIAWQYLHFWSSRSRFDIFQRLQAYSGLFFVWRGVTAFEPVALRNLRFRDLLSSSSFHIVWQYFHFWSRRTHFNFFSVFRLIPVISPFKEGLLLLNLEH